MKNQAPRLILLFGLLLITSSVNSQTIDYQHETVTGMLGLVEIPTARFSSDRIGMLSYSYYPEGSRMVYGQRAGNLVNASLMVTSFMNFSLHLVNPVERETLPHGIGDRSIKLKFLVLTERKYMPAISIGISDIFGVNVWQGALYAVASKSFKIEKFNTDVSLGYGYDIEHSNPVSDFFFYKEHYVNSPLKGFFGGASLHYQHHMAMVEYDSQKLNAGYSYVLDNKWINKYLPTLRLRLGVYTLGFNSFSGQVALYYRFGDRIFR